MNYSYLKKVLTIYRTYYPDFECEVRSVSIVDNAYNTHTASHIFYKVEDEK